MEVFDQLPIAAVVNGLYLCMHGGIANTVTSVEAINQIDRRQEPPDEDCILKDLLWADPASNWGIDTDYVFNEARATSVIFGKGPVNSFLEKEGLKAIIRAHECKKNGFKKHLWNGND